MQYRFLWQLASTLFLSRCCSGAMITVGVTVEPANVAVDYGADTAKITCSFKVMPEVVSSPQGSLVTFSAVPDRVVLILRNDHLESLIYTDDVFFRDEMNLTFQLRNVRESSRFSCDVSSSELSRPAREFVAVYVKTDAQCDSIQDLFRNRYCFDEQSVCKTGFHLHDNRISCEKVYSPKNCASIDVCKQCTCQRKEKRVARVPYKGLATNKEREIPNAVSVSGQLYGFEEVMEVCYLCANDKKSSNFTTALIVTFLVLLSGAMTIIGAAVFYDWYKRRHDLQELEREHTDSNPDAVEVAALRRVLEDRPPSYVETRKSDLDLAGIPPPLYEDIYRSEQQISRVLAASSPRLAGSRGSVPYLEPIHERRLST